MATLEELEARVDRLQWQLKNAVMLMPDSGTLSLSYFIILYDISEAELTALDGVFASYAALETFNKDDLTTDAMATLSEHSGVVMETVVKSFYNANKYIPVCEEWCRQ